MIHINKGETNTIAVTLTEKTTIALDLVKYLFIFENAQSKETFACIGEDLSDHIVRYNLFEIIETEDPDPLVGEIELPLTDFYYYYIYEQTSTTNLDPTGLTLVESGMAKVWQTTPSTATYNNLTNEIPVYDKSE
jgi:hypothetical protein